MVGQVADLVFQAAHEVGEGHGQPPAQAVVMVARAGEDPGQFPADPFAVQGPEETVVLVRRQGLVVAP